MATKYLEQWVVPSESDPDKTYKVTQYENGVWKCGCPRWIFSLQKKGEDCKHIIAVKGGEYKPGLHLPIIGAMCKQVELRDGVFIHPLVPLGWPETTDFVYTQLYDLAMMGEDWQDIREAFKVLLRKGFPPRASVIAWVEQRGRCIIKEDRKIGKPVFEYVEVKNGR